ncbi:MAG: Nif3-like dinuclear metal center hexameric protein, partial [Candidatus Nanohaloarchaea archaeon]|nr:Nif3-like dinuclear metal center hexameric protein [Candidatus Nanohaloarchaea archaeon]
MQAAMVYVPMVSRGKLIDWLDDELDVEHYMAEGDNLNGALVRGTEDVERIGLCVNTTFENIETAAEQDLDFVISHHGGWEDFDQDLLPEKKRKIEEHGLTWYIAHASLDCKDGYGVAAALAEKLGVEIDGAFAEYEGGKAGRYGHLTVDRDEFIDRLRAVNDGDFTLVGSLPDLEDAKIGVIGGSGGAFNELLKDTADHDIDLLVTGNASFAGKIYMYEKGLAMITLEETSSEKWGVYRLGERVADRFTSVSLH